MRTLQSTSDSHEDVGDMLDPLVDNTETEEATEGQTEELARLAEDGVYETVDIHVASGQEASYVLLGAGPQEKDGIRARFVPKEFKSDETMCGVFALSSTPSTDTHRRLLECQEVVSHTHCRRDPTRTSTWTRTKSVTWTHWLNGWNSRPHWGIRLLCCGDCETAERSETRWNTPGRLQGGTPWRAKFPQMQHHKSMQTTGWMCSLRYTWMISMPLDRDRRWIWSKPTSKRKSVARSGQ